MDIAIIKTYWLHTLIIISYIVIVGITLCRVRRKDLLKKLFIILIITIALAVFTFSTVSMAQRFNNAWEAATSSFTLLGVLLTGGGAVAATVAIMSYLSLSKQLDKANDELVKANDISKSSKSTFEEANKKLGETDKKLEEAEQKLVNIEKLKEIENDLINETTNLKKFKSFTTEYRENLDAKSINKNKDLYDKARELSEKKALLFYERLIVNTIITNYEANKAFGEAEQAERDQDSQINTYWEKAYYLFQQSSEYWKILFLNDKKCVRNYTNTLFNCAYILAKLDDQDYDKRISLYKQTVLIRRNYGLKNIQTALNNLGNALDKKARITTNNDFALKLFKEAIDNYQQAIKLDKNYLTPYGGLLNTLKKGIKTFKKYPLLLKELLTHTQSSLNKIKTLEKNAECEAKFNEIVTLVEDKLAELNAETPNNPS